MALFDASAPDAALVAEALRDNPAAFERLVLRYQRRAHAIARALGVPAGSVDDVVQESFLQALSGLRGLRAPAAFGPWFLAIARNLSRKEAAARKELLGPARKEPAAPGESADLEEIREVLWREVARLPEGIREAIFLYYHEGESVRQVARALAISRSAAKSRLQRGRDQLRERLWRELEGALREMVPSTPEWRRRGRKLTLLLVTAAASEGALAPVEAAAQASEAAGGFSPLLLTGVLAMSTKKVLVGAALASLLLAASIGVVKLASPPREGGESAAVPVAPAPLAASAAGKEEETIAVALMPAVTGISGLVVLEETSAPVAGARVAAVRDGERRHAMVVETGADGAYSLAGLGPGKYRLWAWREDLACRRSGDSKVEVRQEEVTGGQDLVLVPGVVIEGRVLEEGTGMPIHPAEVSFERLQFALADADGLFRIEGVPEGLVTIAAHAPEHARRSIEIDAAHGEKPFVTIELARGGVIEGTVSEPGGGPAAGAEVFAWGPSGGGSARTDAERRYRIDGIPLTATGDMVVTASRGGRFAALAGFPGFPSGESRIALDLRLAQGHLLRGRVVDPAGRPLAGARIELMGSSVFEELRADDEGRFSIDGAGDNMYTLHVKKEGRAPASVDLRELSPEQREEIEVVLEEGRAVEGIVVDTKGAPITGAFVYVEDGMGLTHTTEADAGGRFRIEDLPAELREIGADKEGHAMVRSEEVKAGQRDVRLVLDEAAKIEGIAIDVVTGEPVHPLLVKISGAEGEFREKNKRKGSRGALLASFTRVGLPFDFADGGFKIRHGLAPGDFLPAPRRRPRVQRGHRRWGRGMAADGGPRARADRAGEGRGAPGPRGRRRDRGARGRRQGEPRRGGPPAPTGLLARLSSRRAHLRPRGAHGHRGELRDPWTSGGAGRDPPREARVRAYGGHRRGPRAEGGDLRVGRGRGHRGDRDKRRRRAGPWSVGFSGHRRPGVPAREHRRARVVSHRGAPRRNGTGRDEPWGAPREGPDRGARRRRGHGHRLPLRLRRHRRARDGGGRPFPGARVLVKRTSNPDEQEWLSADGAGAFRAAGLEPGSYEVKAVRPDSGFFEGLIRIVEVGNEEVRCEIALGPAAGLSGRVVDRVSGNPVPGTHVMLYKHHPGFFRGTFVFPGSDWAPVKGCHAEGDEARFRLEVSEAGKYLLAAPQGWLGPIDIEPGRGAADLELRVGGKAAVALVLRDARTGGAIDRASIVLRPAGGYPFGIGGGTGAAGAADIAGVPPGKYRLEAQGPEHLPAFEDIEVGEARLERQLTLEPAAWVAVKIGGAASQPRKYSVKAILIAGGDPGWTFSTMDGKPLTLGSTRDGGDVTVRLKTRAGRYTIRFEVTSLDIYSPPILAEELEVDVPDGGEARVLLALPGE